MQRVLRQDHYATPSGATYPNLTQSYRIGPVPDSPPLAQPAEVMEDGRVATSTARIDIYRLFVALFGLSLYLGLPAAGLVYLGMQMVS